MITLRNHVWAHSLKVDYMFTDRHCDDTTTTTASYPKWNDDNKTQISVRLSVLSEMSTRITSKRIELESPGTFNSSIDSISVTPRLEGALEGLWQPQRTPEEIARA